MSINIRLTMPSGQQQHHLQVVTGTIQYSAAAGAGRQPGTVTAPGGVRIRTETKQRGLSAVSGIVQTSPRWG